MIEPQNQSNNNFRNWMYFWIFIGSFVVFYVVYNFYFEKDFPILVEESCDPSMEQCFYRNCEDEECPPNELEYYSQYYVEASDFTSCESTNDCNLNTLCTDNPDLCEKIECISGVDECYISEQS